MIGHEYGDNDVAERARARLRRMRRLDSQSSYRSKSERNLAYGFAEINRLVSQLSLGWSHRDQAALLYRRAQTADLFHGRDLDQMAGGAVYAAVRIAELGRLPSEIAAVARCDESDLKMGYNVMVRELNLKIGPPSPVDYIPRIASLLDLSEDLETVARRVARKAAADPSFAGSQPSGIAGACVYVASQQAGGSLTQADVAEAADVTTPTIRSGRDALLASDHVQTKT